MATAAKNKAETKSDAAEDTAAPPPNKNKKLLIIIVVAILVLIGGGTTAYLLLKPTTPSKHASKEETEAADTSSDKSAPEPEKKLNPPKYVTLGTFTANLIHEDVDRYLQVAISLKLSKSELEEQIKASNPEILHHVNMLLQSKRPSELATPEGKEKLAFEIKSRIEQVLGLIKVIPSNTSTQPASAPIAEMKKSNTGIEDVLFTSFIIQ